MALWEDGHLSGLRSAQPAASSVGEGVCYLVTDEGVMEQNVSGTWTAVGSPSTLSDGDIPASIARDSEVTSAISTHASDADAHHDEAHAASHASGGGDAVKLDDLAAPDDNTDLDATPSAHGLLPKLSGTATEYLDGSGAFSTPAGGGGGGSLYENLTVSGATTVDRDNGETQDLTLTGDATLTPDPGSLTGVAIDLRLLIRQDSTGSHTLAWGGTITWVGGSAPTMPSGADEMMTVGLVSVDDGTTWLGYYDRVGTGLTNPMTTAGDVIYSSDGSGTPARLAAGSDGEVLTLASGVPSWAAAAGGSGLSTGTSFPGSPSAGDRYRRSDIDYMVFFYDGTRWVSEQIFKESLGRVSSISSTASVTDTCPTLKAQGYDAFLLNFTWVPYVNGTNSGSAYWTAQLTYIDSGGGNTAITAGMNTSADSGSTALSKNEAIDAVLTSDALVLGVLYTETGSAGNLYSRASITYRMIAT